MELGGERFRPEDAPPEGRRSRARSGWGDVTTGRFPDGGLERVGLNAENSASVGGGEVGGGGIAATRFSSWGQDQ